MKNIIKDTIFIIIFILLFKMFSNILILKGNSFGSDVVSFYEEKRNSLDIIFFGSSHSYATFSPEIIKKKTNLESYNFATQRQPINITYHYMLESLKTQKPSYFVLESYMLLIDDIYFPEGVLRDSIDKMKNSVNKIKTINENVYNKKDRIYYYFNIFKYHSRYNELQDIDKKSIFKIKSIKNKGYKPLNQNFEIIIDNSKVISNESLPISNYNKEYLDKIINVAKKNNIYLIIVKSPCNLSKEEYEKINWLETYLNDEGITFINYNKNNIVELKPGDFYDYRHLSKTGSEKISIDFSNYLLSIQN